MTAPGHSVLRVPMRAFLADGDAPDVEHVAVQPVAGEVHLGLDRASLPEREQAGDRRHRVQVDVLADLGTERSRVELQRRRAGEVEDARLVGEALGQPDAQMRPAASRVGTGLDASQHHPRTDGRRRPDGPAG